MRKSTSRHETCKGRGFKFICGVNIFHAQSIIFTNNIGVIFFRWSTFKHRTMSDFSPMTKLSEITLEDLTFRSSQMQQSMIFDDEST